MNRILFGVMALAFGVIPVTAQSLEDLNIQIHGYATQSFLYSTQNNLFSTNSSSGSPAWNETVVNITSQPIPKLRIGVQARYFLLGNYGNTISLDWASADYKVNDRVGVRFGKVKQPIALLNEMQDIDPAYTWCLLPQSVYAILSREATLAADGGVVYGTLKLGPKLGKIDYYGYGGDQIIAASSPIIAIPRQMTGINLPNGWNGPLVGASLHWRTPIQGLMVGASDYKTLGTWSTVAIQGSLTGTQWSPSNQVWYVYARYEKDKVMVAGELYRTPFRGWTTFSGQPTSYYRVDQWGWYTMATYKLTGKLTAGAYDSQGSDHQQSLGLYRYNRDWTMAARYDFNQFIYAKAEQHFMNGALLNYDFDMNPNGLKPTTKLTILKVGVSF